MHVVDLGPVLEAVPSLEEGLEATENLWTEIYDEMSAEETLWVFVPGRYEEGTRWPASMAIADVARRDTDLTLKNVVTRFVGPEEGGDLRDAHEEILFLVKDRREYRFDKDAIRVDHVYEGNEWGDDREAGTSAYHDTEVQWYNPEGKDPGNVWLVEKRDHSADEALDETRPLSRAEAVSRCVRAGSDPGEPVHLWTADGAFEETVVAEGREPNVRHLDHGDHP